ncbi:MAG: protein-L-isoaspartate(D-aspartate) O-methyltransferase [Alphaproteobacteria bacterium]|nr:protein-L-isoaspartate(D-aspartate) O-methyltransferase [Alphaproteobacteria bacterium]
MSLEARKIRLIMLLRRSGITDTSVLAAIERVPREIFVPEPFQDQAYENKTLPIGHSQTLSQPEIVASMTQALSLNKKHKVLEIGTGSGYQTAVLSCLAKRVYTIERYLPLLNEAKERLHKLCYSNIVMQHADGSVGWIQHAPFDRIIITAAAADFPHNLFDQLVFNGIMVLPLGSHRGKQELYRVTRTEQGPVYQSIGPVKFVPLIKGNLPKDN